MNTTQTPFPGNPQDNPDASGEYNSGFARSIDKLSSIIAESIHVLDIRHRRFCYISPNDLVLCGLSTGDALKDRDGFLKNTVYPADYPLWIDMHKAILQYLKEAKEKREEIDYFSCTFRLQRRYNFLAHPLPQMIFLRIKPDWKEDELQYLICAAGSSTAKKAGNLRMYYKNRSTYEAYHFGSKRWKQKTIEPLTEYEKAILMLAGQGYATKEIAQVLCTGYHTLCNKIKKLYLKLDIHSMQEAIEVANHRNMIYTVVQDVESQPAETSGEKGRGSLTKENLQRIQQYLNDGRSIRQAAKQEDIAEGAIRYWIKRGKLKK